MNRFQKKENGKPMPKSNLLDVFSERNYMLVNKQIVPCNDLMAWGRWMGTKDRIVKQETLMIKEDKIQREVQVSTVFLGLDHGFGQGRPVLFETMVFGGKQDQQICMRCCSYQEAIQQHQRVKAYITGKIDRL